MPSYVNSYCDWRTGFSTASIGERIAKEKVEEWDKRAAGTTREENLGKLLQLQRNPDMYFRVYECRYRTRKRLHQWLVKCIYTNDPQNKFFNFSLCSHDF